MENNRLLFAVFLSVLIWVVWLAIFPPPTPVDGVDDGNGVVALDEQARDRLAGDAPSSDEPVDRSMAGSSADGTGAEDPLLAEVPTTTTIDFAGAESVVARDEASIRLENSRYEAVLTNRGAQLTSFVVKGQLNEAGEPLDLVRRRGSDLYPFALLVGGSGTPLNRVLYDWQLDEIDSAGAQELRFRYLGPEGSAEKVFRVHADGIIDVEVKLPGQRDWGVILGPGINNKEGKGYYGQTVDRAVGYSHRGDTDFDNAKDVDEERFLSARGLSWISLEDNYFLAAAIPGLGVSEAWIRPVLERPEVVAGEPRFIDPASAGDEEDLKPEVMLVIRAAADQLAMKTYFGAKRYSYLSSLEYGLDDTIRWGFLGFLSKPLYQILQWVYHNMVANYGWAIMIVTLLIRLVFFPLTHKSQESMTKMQELNPKVQAIRAKYRPKLKDKQGRPNVDAQRQMNEEVMKVYKTAGVNPAGGCLPMLLQMPVFFAFYRLLTAAVELRGAEWILWITDLSAKDPYYVLPIIMGVTSLAMQKMMPSSPDPMQKRLMQMMPIMFTVFALYFPSGLVLYWMTNNLLTMAQQALIIKLKARKQAAAAAG